MKDIIRILLGKCHHLIRIFPGWTSLLIKYCSVGQPVPTTLTSRVVRELFNIEYFHRSNHSKLYIQSILMGGDAGAQWADHYDSPADEGPLESEADKMTESEWLSANPSFAHIRSLLDNGKSYLFIQIGASSGKEIGFLAKSYQNSTFIYTDFLDSVTRHAEKKRSLANLKFVTCPGEFTPELVHLFSDKDVIIFSSGSSQYMFPENIDLMFSRLKFLSGTTVHLIFQEPGSTLEENPLTLEGSKPRGSFSYTHNYAYYAEKYGLEVRSWQMVERNTDSPKEHHRHTVALSGWFTKAPEEC